MASNEIEIIVEVDDRASPKLGDISSQAGRIGDSMQDSMQRFSDAVDRATDRARDRFKGLRIGDGKDSDFAGGLAGSLRDLTGAFTNVGGAAGAAGAQVAGAAASAGLMAAGGTVASGGLNLVAAAALAAAGAAASAAAGFFALAPALSAVGGLAGGAITGLLGAGVAAGTLGIGLGGVADAWNAYGKSAGGGGGASKAAGDMAYQAARRIEMAEDSLTKAKRAAREASRDVNRARAEERERIEDLTLALRGQKFAQEDASQSLKSAEEKLAREKAYGNSTSQDAAQKEVDRAKYRYDYETERLKDLEKEKATADRKGIEGSELVRSALDRERDAAEAVTAAQKALADAKRKVEVASGGAAGGVNAFNDAMSKLSPNAQKFVRTLIDLKEKFADVKRQVQDRLFAGLDVTLREMAEAWGPKLVPIFGGMADSINRMAKGLAESLSDPTFISNVEEISASFGRFLETLGEAGSRLIDAFGRIGAAASPVLEKIGFLIYDIADGFADWIEKADKTDALDQFMRDAADTLQHIYDIGGLVFGIMGEIIEILFPESKKSSDHIFMGVKAGLDAIKSWLGDPENQQMIRDMISDFKEFFKRVVDKYIPEIIRFGKRFGEMAAPIAKVIGKFMDVHYWLTVKLPRAIEGMARRGGNIFSGVKDGFRAAINWIIGKWNSLEFTIPSVTMFGQTIGGGSFGTPNIDYLATGGITGAGRVIMNERGPEAVRLPQGSMVYSAGDSARMMGSGRTSEMSLRVSVDRPTERGLIDMLIGMLRFEIDSRYGGDVQRALGESRA